MNVHTPVRTLLDWHQGRRAGGIPTVTTLAGPVNLAVRTWRGWANPRPVSVVRTAHNVHDLATAWAGDALSVCPGLDRARAWLARVTNRPSTPSPSRPSSPPARSPQPAPAHPSQPPVSASPTKPAAVTRVEAIVTRPQYTPHPQQAPAHAPKTTDSVRRVAQVLTPAPQPWTPHPTPRVTPATALPAVASRTAPAGFENVSRTATIGNGLQAISVGSDFHGNTTLGVEQSLGFRSVGISVQFTPAWSPQQICATSGASAGVGAGASGSVATCLDTNGRITATSSVGPMVQAGGIALGGSKLGVSYSVEVTRETTLLSIPDLLTAPPAHRPR